MWLSAAHLEYLLTQSFVDFAVLQLVFLLISCCISSLDLTLTVEAGLALLALAYYIGHAFCI